jgi:hypothetical protein
MTGNTILDLLKMFDNWSTQDIETLISLLQDYLNTERKEKH